MKIRPVGGELFHADRRTNRRTDITNLIVVFRNFVNAPKNSEALVVARKDIGLEIHTDKTKYM